MTEPMEPLFLHEETGYRETIAQIAARIAAPGEDKDSIATQLRGFAQRRLIHVRGAKGSGRTAHNLFAPPDVAVAKLLRTLTKLGIADSEVMHIASLACYSWAAGDKRIKHYQTISPVHSALSTFAKGARWAFRLDVWTHDQTGERQISAALYDPQAKIQPSAVNRPNDKGFLPEVSLIVPFYRWIPAVLRGANPKAN